MPILEPFHDEEYAIEDEGLELEPLERPQRISVPPVVIWGAVGLVAVSMTVAAMATLLLPEQLNPVLRSNADKTTDELAQFDEAVEEDATARSQPSRPEDQLPDPLIAASPTPEAITTESPAPDVVTPDNAASSAATSAIVSDAAIVSLEAPATANGSFPIRMILLLTTGCALLSGGVTLALRSWVHRDIAVSLPQPRMPNLHWRQNRNTRQRSRSDATTPPPDQVNPLQPNVMVLPPEAVTPLDEFSDDESGDLAAQLDIRRRYSLSSLIEEDLD